MAEKLRFIGRWACTQSRDERIDGYETCKNVACSARSAECPHRIFVSRKPSRHQEKSHGKGTGR